MTPIPVRAGQRWTLSSYRRGRHRAQTLEVLELLDDDRARVKVLLDSAGIETGQERDVRCERIQARCRFRSGDVPVVLPARQLHALRAVKLDSDRRNARLLWPPGAEAHRVSDQLGDHLGVRGRRPHRNAMRSTVNTLLSLQRKGLLSHTYEKDRGWTGLWHLTYAGEALLEQAVASEQPTAPNATPQLRPGTPRLRRPTPA